MGKELRNFEGYDSPVYSVAFSPDNRYIVSGSMREGVRLCDAETGKELICFKWEGDFVTSGVFSPNGRYILGRSRDKTVRLWELDWEWEFPQEQHQKGEI